MNKADGFQNSAQELCFSGEAGSPKRLAHDLLATLSDFAVVRFGPGTHSPRMAEELLELSRQDLVKALQCESDVFQKITEIATAINDRNSKYFRMLATGLDLIPHGYSLKRPAGFAFRAFMHWTRPNSEQWFCEWSLPEYKEFIEKSIEPTKPQLRAVTKRFMAVYELKKGQHIPSDVLATDLQSPKVEDQIAKEVAKITWVNWTHVLRELGLNYLKSGHAGRPRRNQYKKI